MKEMNLKELVAHYDENYINIWRKIMAEYRSQDNKLWIAGPSAYIFSINGTKFAVDLQIRRMNDFQTLKDSLVEDLKDLDFILVTHQHDDHMCCPLMNALKETSVHWYIPSEVMRSLVYDTGLPEENITWLNDGDVIERGGIKITAFNSPHIPFTEDEALAQLGYKLQTDTISMLMPCDVREYDYKAYPEFGEIDICFSHLWGGNNAIDQDKYMPYFEKYAKFTADFGAKKYYMGHLYEVGRDEIYMWKLSHAEKATKLLREYVGDTPIIPVELGDAFELEI